MLPKENSRSTFELSNKQVSRNLDIIQMPEVEDIKKKAEFINKIEKYVTPIERDILILRYVYGEEYASIAKELKLIGVETVIRVHNESLQKLKRCLA